MNRVVTFGTASADDRSAPSARIGVVGGVGAQATADFYLQLFAQWRLAGHNTYPDVVVHSPPIRTGLERVFIEGRPSEAESLEVIALIGGAIDVLEISGATVVAIPCNSIHALLPALESGRSIHIIDLLQETVTYLGQEDVCRIGVLAGRATRESMLYEVAVAKQDLDIEVVYPPSSEQAHMERLLVQFLLDPSARRELTEATTPIIDGLLRYVDVVVLACTDICFMKMELPFDQGRVVSSLECLVGAAIAASTTASRHLD